jgi:hypothetical protein
MGSNIPIAKREWTYKEKQVLKGIQQSAFVYEWLHDRTSRYYYRLFNYIALPAYLIHLLVAGGALSGLQTGGSQWVQACTVAFATFGMLLKAVDDTKQFKQRATDHERASRQFSELHRAIHRECCKPENERQDATYFIAAQDDKYTQLKQIISHIPDHIVRQYEMLKDSGDFEGGIEKEFEEPYKQLPYDKTIMVSPFSSPQKVIAFQTQMRNNPHPKQKMLQNVQNMPQNQPQKEEHIAASFSLGSFLRPSSLISPRPKRPLDIIVEKSLNR